MVHLFSPQIWLLLLIVLGSAIPLVYLMQHMTRSPARYNPPGFDDDYSWRTTRNLTLNIVTLVGLMSAAVIIASGFPPGTIGPSMPFLFIAGLLGAGPIYTCADGIKTGHIVPFGSAGMILETSRASNPKTFWFIVILNLLFGLAALFPSAIGIASNFPSTP